MYRLIKNSHFFRSLLNRFNNISLHKKIMLSYFFFIGLLVSTLAISIYTYTAASIRRQNAFSLQQNFNQALSYLSYKLNALSSSSDMLIYSADLNAILGIEPEGRSDMQQIADSRTIINLLKNMQENDDIAQARVYVPDELNYSGNNVNICSFSQARSSDWWEPLFQRKGIHLFVGAADLEDLPYPDRECISLLRAMYRQDNYSELAFILRLDVPADSIESILYSANYTSDSLTLLIDSSGKIIVRSGLSSPAFLKDGQDILELPDFPQDTITRIRLNDINMLALQNTVSNTGWTMVTLVPYSSFTMATTSLMATTLGVSFLILLLAWFLSKPIAYTITKRIDVLCGYMKQTKDGILEKLPGIPHKDEIGSLYENYNFMISRLHDLLHENYQIGQELKSAEYKALQSQINPHFLYNTLDMISWMAYQNKSAEISQAVYSLANFYKLSLAKGKYIVPLSDELNHVTYYMKIQELRFSGNITLCLDVPPILLQFSIPKITLQPIVENAVFHGILEKKSKKGSIRISGMFLQNQYRLTVSDDGVGIPSEQLDSLTNACKAGHSETAPNTSDSGSHYGLQNIDKRIKLQYGEKYGLSFESVRACGTKVHILLPAVHVDEI